MSNSPMKLHSIFHQKLGTPLAIATTGDALRDLCVRAILNTIFVIVFVVGGKIN
jgi:hypothetical protein